MKPDNTGYPNVFKALLILESTSRWCTSNRHLCGLKTREARHGIMSDKHMGAKDKVVRCATLVFDLLIGNEDKPHVWHITV